MNSLPLNARDPFLASCSFLLPPLLSSHDMALARCLGINLMLILSPSSLKVITLS